MTSSLPACGSGLSVSVREPSQAAASRYHGTGKAVEPETGGVVPLGLWWCNTHQREATCISPRGRRYCDPSLGGILLPCMVVMAPMMFDDAQARKARAAAERRLVEKLRFIVSPW